MVAGKSPFFFKKRASPTAQGANKHTIRWVDIFQTLISNGHRKADLACYTERQILLFYQSIQRQTLLDKANLAEAINLGFAGGKELSNYLKRLRSTE